MKKLIIVLLALGLFASCQENKKQEQAKPVKKETVKPAFDEMAYKKKGKEIAMATFKAFKGHIQKIAGKDGLPAVVNFCNVQALKLTDSMANVYKVEIKRTSHKLRNPKNAPNTDEKAVINNYLQLQEEPKELIPVVMKDDEGFVHFYAPIKIKQECLKCHGKMGQDLNEKVYKTIKMKYPNDKAIGFREGELRGIWDIKFLKK